MSGIATFRYNFPYMEHGTGRDSQAVCTATVRSAVAAAHGAAPDLPLLAGGHSFGGRMTSRLSGLFGRHHQSPQNRLPYLTLRSLSDPREAP